MLNRVDARKAILVNADLSGARLDQADLRGADLTSATLARTQARNADLSGARLWGVEARESALVRCALNGADLTRAGFAGASLQGSALQSAEAADVDLEGCDLSRSQMQQARLQRARAKGAQMKGALLHLADLREADLSGADLSGANLQGADLRGADLSGASLRRGDLQGADLRGVNLRGADLLGAQVEEAAFDGALLQGADLRVVGAQRASWRGATEDRETRWPEGFASGAAVASGLRGAFYSRRPMAAEADRRGYSPADPPPLPLPQSLVQRHDMTLYAAPPTEGLQGMLSWLAGQRRRGQLQLTSTGITANIEGRQSAQLTWGEPFALHPTVWLVPGEALELGLTLVPLTGPTTVSLLRLRILLPQRDVSAALPIQQIGAPWIAPRDFAMLWPHLTFHRNAHGEDIRGWVRC